jgi:hypothetical protein
VLVAAAVCPHPPLLIPQLAGGAAPELDDLRAACAVAIRRVLATRPDRIVVVGAGRELRGQGLGGSTARYGLDVHVGAPGDASLPLSLTIGCWLLERARCEVPVEYVGLAPGTEPRACAARLEDEVGGARPTGVLAMADLSAKLTTTSPGYLDPRAEVFDRSVVAALRRADTGALAGLDAELADQLWCSGVPALAALGGAARSAGGVTITTRIEYDAAPYGVGYVVADWLVAQPVAPTLQ